jgi:hypothetical protein
MDMKKSANFIFGFLLISLLFLSSCEKTNTDPDTDPRAQYLGSWTCAESALGNYPVTISLDSSNSSQILIHNFHLWGSSGNAYLIATQNNLTLPTQNILTNTVNGSGNLVNNNKFTLTYYVNDGTNITTVNAVYTK